MQNDLHLKITGEAISRLRAAGTPMPNSARTADLVAVHIDLFDTLPTFYEGEFYKMNHDSPGAQHRHFMRSKGQTVEQAHKTSLDYIKSQAEESAVQFQRESRATSKLSAFVCEVAVNQSMVGGGLFVAGTAGTYLAKNQRDTPLAFINRSQQIPESLCSAAWPLGLAAHTLEDSFSPSHVIRDGRQITDILVYAEQDHHDHDEKDASKDSFEDAVQSVMALFTMVRETIKSGSSALVGWDTFVQNWLKLRSNSEKTPLMCPLASGPLPKIQRPLAMSRVTGSTHHIVKGGESLSVIAGSFYQDVLLWPHIFDANRKLIRNPNQIRKGLVLNIPAPPDESQRSTLRERGRQWRSYNTV